MNKIEKVISRIIELSGISMIIPLLGIMMLIVIDVILRFFRMPITGGVEIIAFLMVCLFFLGLGWCLLKERHIRVDLISGILSKRSRVILDILNCLAAMMLGIIMTTQSVSRAMFAQKLGTSSKTLGIPEFPFILVVAFGCFLLFFAALLLLYKIKKEYKVNKD